MDPVLIALSVSQRARKLDNLVPDMDSLCTVVWTEVLKGRGLIMRAKAKETTNQYEPAINNFVLNSLDHLTTVRAPVKHKAVGKNLFDRLATEQVQVEAEMKRLEAELEQTKAWLVNSSSVSDSASE